MGRTRPNRTKTWPNGGEKWLIKAKTRPIMGRKRLDRTKTRKNMQRTRLDKGLSMLIKAGQGQNRLGLARYEHN